jgi:hypothetical protein
MLLVAPAAGLGPERNGCSGAPAVAMAPRRSWLGAGIGSRYGDSGSGTHASVPSEHAVEVQSARYESKLRCCGGNARGGRGAGGLSRMLVGTWVSRGQAAPSPPLRTGQRRACHSPQRSPTASWTADTHTRGEGDG